jgi:hypothetical protein
MCKSRRFRVGCRRCLGRSCDELVPAPKHGQIKFDSLYVFTTIYIVIIVQALVPQRLLQLDSFHAADPHISVL